jgi:hypothetical protein
MEERRTAELLSDFDDYKIGKGHADEELDGNGADSSDSEDGYAADKAPRKKKKAR